MTQSTNGRTRTEPVVRNDYREGQILRARDLERESDYFLVRYRQHNALAHGPGILLGLGPVAFKRGTEEAVTEETLAADGPTPLDLAITAGAAIDWLGRFIIVPKREPVDLELATTPAVLDPGTYRLELLYERASASRSRRHGASVCDDAGEAGGVVRESFSLRLVEHDPDAETPDLELGSVLDGPTDDPAAIAPVTLGLVEWDGSNYVGYSGTGRVYAPVTGHRLVAPDRRAELELRDGNGRFVVRMAEMPEADAEDPFTPLAPEDRFRVDGEGAVWVRAEVSVGPDGVRFRQEADSTEESRWRACTVTSQPGAAFGMDDQPQPQKLQGDAYVAGARELRVLFERDGTNQGRQRVVIGTVDDTGGDFKPALVVYDRPPSSTGQGSATVEVWGDLYVRGTAWLNAAARRPPQPGAVEDELDFILRQLAGPLAGVFRSFLLSDPDWLNDLATVIADRIQAPSSGMTSVFVNALKNAVANVLKADASFVSAISAAAATQIQGDEPAAAAIAANVAKYLSPFTSPIAFPDPANTPRGLLERLMVAYFGRVLWDGQAYQRFRQAIDPELTPDQEDRVSSAFKWLTATTPP